jgi:hypothetical protein
VWELVVGSGDSASATLQFAWYELLARGCSPGSAVAGPAAAVITTGRLAGSRDSPIQAVTAASSCHSSLKHPQLQLQGTDLRDALLGRVFGYAAVLRSGQPVGGKLAAGMAAGLLAAAQKKSFLREVAGEAAGCHDCVHRLACCGGAARPTCKSKVQMRGKDVDASCCRVIRVLELTSSWCCVNRVTTPLNPQWRCCWRCVRRQMTRH